MRVARLVSQGQDPHPLPLPPRGGGEHAVCAAGVNLIGTGASSRRIRPRKSFRWRRRKVRRASPDSSRRLDCSTETRQPEAADVVAWGTRRREVGENFADDRRKLETVTGAGRRKDDVAVAGQAIDEEVAVGGHRIETGLGGDQRPVRRRYETRRLQRGSRLRRAGIWCGRIRRARPPDCGGDAWRS